jgi:hypothetical protein
MKKRSPLRARSAKEAKIKAQYTKVCREIDEEVMEAFGYLACSSCHMNVNYGSWGHSHNLPKGRFKHLETDKRNIAIRCQNWEGHHGCHEKLDGMDINEIVTFEDFDDIMAYRFEHAPEEYNKMVTAIIEAGIETNYNYHDESFEEETEGVY